MSAYLNDTESGNANNVKEWFNNSSVVVGSDTAPTYPPRPISITVVCVIIGLALVYNVFELITLLSKSSGSGVAVLVSIIILAQMGLVLTSLVNLWQMRKVGAYLYTVNFFLNVVWILIAGNGIGYLSIIFGVYLLMAIYFKIDKME